MQRAGRLVGARRSNPRGCPPLGAGPAQRRDPGLAAGRFVGCGCFGPRQPLALFAASHPEQGMGKPDPEKKPPPAGTRLSNQGLSTALQEHWGAQWRGGGRRGPSPPPPGWLLTHPMSIVLSGLTRGRFCSPKQSLREPLRGTALLPKPIHGGGGCSAKARQQKERGAQGCVCAMRDAGQPAGRQRWGLGSPRS